VGATKFHSKNYKIKVQVNLGCLSTSMDERKRNDFSFLTTCPDIDKKLRQKN